MKGLERQEPSPIPYCGDITESYDNSLKKVRARQKVVALEVAMRKEISTGGVDDISSECTLKHYFSPIVEKYGCGTYAREITLPKGSVVVGKIHKHSHINIISKGKVSVVTEHGKKYYTAPCTFVSEVGLKRAVYAEEETIWTTIHLTSNLSESELDKIEEEVIAESYEEIGLIASEEELNLLATEAKGEVL